MNNIEKVNEIFGKWETTLLPNEQKYIHFRSMNNFAFHFNQLDDEREKDKVSGILESYIEEVQENNFDYKGLRSYDLAKKYMDQISGIYRSKLGFKPLFDLRVVILFSIVGDGILYFILRKFLTIYFPIISLSLLTYYFHTKISLGRKRKIFGLFY